MGLTFSPTVSNRLFGLLDQPAVFATVAVVGPCFRQGAAEPSLRGDRQRDLQKCGVLGGQRALPQEVAEKVYFSVFFDVFFKK